jgi:nucleolar complex protein 2
MGKHKQSKRERKFEAKGGVKAQLDKGGTIVSKGKKKKLMGKKRKDNDDKKEIAQQKQQKRAQKNSDEYKQQIRAQRDAQDFTGRDNLGDMDVNSFFASLEQDLKNTDDVSSATASSDGEGGDSSEEEDEDKVDQKKQVKNEPPKKKEKKGSEVSLDNEDEQARKKLRKSEPSSSKSPKDKKSKEDNGDESGSDSSIKDDNDSSSEDSQPKTKKNAKTFNSERKLSMESDSDSEDEDIEAVEAKMKAEMKRLQSQDPDFHEFLKENERSLLEFGDEHDEDDDDDDGGDDDDDDDIDVDDDDKLTKQKKSKNENKEDKLKNSIELTPKILKQLSHGAFDENGIKSLKKLLKAYKSACKVATNTEEDADDDQLEGPKKRKRQTTQEKTYRIESSQVFDRLMMTCLGRCHEAFYFHLLATDQEEKENTTTGSKADETKTERDDETEENEDNREGKIDVKDDDKMDAKDDEEDVSESKEDSDEKPLDPKVLERSPKWTEIKPLLNVFLRSTLYLISESKEPDLLAIVLKSLDKYIRYMTPFPRIADALLKTLTGLWSAPLGDASADYQVVRLNAFLRIRQLALTQPFPFIEVCLKKTYLAYARRAKFGGDSASIMTNALPTLTFMGNCLVELYSLDHSSSYQHAFVYIRQLALLLRGYMQKKTKEAAQQVFCWQFVHCLKLWVAVLSTCCKQAREGISDGKNADQLMRELVYPLTEIILGTVRLLPAPARHVPLRFHCIRLCQQLAASTEKFIPTTSLLMPVLDLKEINLKPKKIKSKGGSATIRGVQLPFMLKLSKDDPLRTAEEQEAVVAEFFKLLNRELDLYRYSPGFPEFQFNINQKLKKVRRVFLNL